MARVDDLQEKIDKILEWADDNPQFDRRFVERIQEALENKGELTPGQEQALDNIIERWNIGVGDN